MPNCNNIIYYRYSLRTHGDQILVHCILAQSAYVKVSLGQLLCWRCRLTFRRRRTGGRLVRRLQRCTAVGVRARAAVGVGWRRGRRYSIVAVGVL